MAVNISVGLTDRVNVSRVNTYINAQIAVNTYINAQIELKKLSFHTPDENGKSKCHVIHVGKNRTIFAPP